MTLRHTTVTLLFIIGALLLTACGAAPSIPGQAVAQQTGAPQTGAPQTGAPEPVSATTRATDNCADAKTGDGGVCILHPSTPGTEGTPAAGEATVGTSVAVDGGSYTNVSVTALADMLKTKDFRLVNVHIPYAGEIEGTDVSVPYDQIEQRLSDLPADKSAKIVLYCRSGRMSEIAARALVKLGYSNIWNLEGGTSAWEQAGLTLVNRG